LSCDGCRRRERWLSRAPALVAAEAILGLTVAVSLAGLAWPRLIAWNLFRPYWFLPRRQYWTAITDGFVHAGIGHLLFNAVTYWFFALPLERVIGDGRFVALYLVGLIASNAGTYFKHRHDPDYACLGASGAVLAVMFAEIVYFPRSSLYLFFVPLPIPAPLFAVAYLAYSWYAARHPLGRINHEAHFDGALAGLAFVALTDWPAWQHAWRSVV
jgi:membrane associated rhomboid family serine protease